LFENLVKSSVITLIKDYIEGKISAYSLDSLWKANGVKENCRFVNLI
jgi:hypothetical protein